MTSPTSPSTRQSRFWGGQARYVSSLRRINDSLPLSLPVLSLGLVDPAPSRRHSSLSASPLFTLRVTMALFTSVFFFPLCVLVGCSTAGSGDPCEPALGKGTPRTRVVQRRRPRSGEHRLLEICPLSRCELWVRGSLQGTCPTLVAVCRLPLLPCRTPCFSNGRVLAFLCLPSRRLPSPFHQTVSHRAPSIAAWCFGVTWCVTAFYS